VFLIFVTQVDLLLLVAMGEAVVYEAVAVHDFADYIEGCINVLDEEWARSASSRFVVVHSRLNVGSLFLDRISANQRIATSTRDSAIHQMATHEHIIVQTTSTNPKLSWPQPTLPVRFAALLSLTHTGVRG